MTRSGLSIFIIACTDEGLQYQAEHVIRLCTARCESSANLQFMSMDLV